MATNAPSQLQAIDPTVLAGVVRQDQRSPDFEITSWSAGKLSDKGATGEDALILFKGEGRDAQGSRPWSVFPLLGWGLGLALHGISVFMLGTGSDLRERLVQKERERLQRRQGPGGTP